MSFQILTLHKNLEPQWPPVWKETPFGLHMKPRKKWWLKNLWCIYIHSIVLFFPCICIDIYIAIEVLHIYIFFIHSTVMRCESRAVMQLKGKLNTVHTRIQGSAQVGLIVGQKRGGKMMETSILHLLDPLQFSLFELRWKTLMPSFRPGSGAKPIKRRMNQRGTKASWIFLCCRCPKTIWLIESHQEDLRSLQSGNSLLVENCSHTRPKIQAPNGGRFDSSRTISPLLDEDLSGMGKHHARHCMKRGSPDWRVVSTLRWGRMFHQRAATTKDNHRLKVQVIEHELASQRELQKLTHGSSRQSPGSFCQTQGPRCKTMTFQT